MNRFMSEKAVTVTLTGFHPETLLGEVYSDTVSVPLALTLAETVLFSMLADQKAKETEDGFLLEDGNNDELAQRRNTQIAP